MTAAELAGGFGHRRVRRRASRTRSRCGAWRRCPRTTRRLLLLAAADPIGDPLLLWRAAAQPRDRAARPPRPAVDAGLLDIGAQVRFRPSARCARRPTARRRRSERHAVHAALAEATDPQLDPDRRAWHRAQATPCARRGGRGGARALRRAGAGARRASRPRRRSSSARRRSPRNPRAARAAPARRGRGRQRDAGALDAGADAAGRGRERPARRAAGGARSSSCGARSRSTSGASARPPGCCVGAARRFDALDSTLARDHAPEGARRGDVGRRPDAPCWRPPRRRAPRRPRRPSRRAVDLLVDGFALRVTEGYAAAAPTLRRALDAVLALEVSQRHRPLAVAHGLARRRDRRDGAVGRRGLAHARRAPRRRSRARWARSSLLQFGLQSLVRTRPARRRSGRRRRGRSRRCARSRRRPGPRRSPTPR